MDADKATRDKEGYWWIQSRIDDVLKVAGHRISNAEVESAAVSHPKVAEAAVIGQPDEVKGEKIVAFVILRDGVSESEDLKKDISKHVRTVLGPVAYPDTVYFVNDIPKTRSGKVMGVIQELGDAVVSLKKGDRVVVTFNYRLRLLLQLY